MSDVFCSVMNYGMGDVELLLRIYLLQINKMASQCMDNGA
jgi:hypothetical protein